jgi:hypothetical protein
MINALANPTEQNLLNLTTFADGKKITPECFVMVRNVREKLKNFWVNQKHLPAVQSLFDVFIGIPESLVKWEPKNIEFVQPDDLPLFELMGTDELGEQLVLYEELATESSERLAAIRSRSTAKASPKPKPNAKPANLKPLAKPKAAGMIPPPVPQQPGILSKSTATTIMPALVAADFAVAADAAMGVHVKSGH